MSRSALRLENLVKSPHGSVHAWDGSVYSWGGKYAPGQVKPGDGGLPQQNHSDHVHYVMGMDVSQVPGLKFDMTFVCERFSAGFRMMRVQLDEYIKAWNGNRDFWEGVVPTPKTLFEKTKSENVELRRRVERYQWERCDHVMISKDQGRAISDLIALWRSDSASVREIERIVSILETNYKEHGTNQIKTILGLRQILSDTEK